MSSSGEVKGNGEKAKTRRAKKMALGYDGIPNHILALAVEKNILKWIYNVNQCQIHTMSVSGPVSSPRKRLN